MSKVFPLKIFLLIFRSRLQILHFWNPINLSQRWKITPFIITLVEFILAYLIPSKSFTSRTEYACLGLSPTLRYFSSSIFIFPPPQLAPIRNPCSLELSSWAQINSVSNSSSGDWRELAWRGTDSQGAPVRVERPSIALPDTRAS